MTEAVCRKILVLMLILGASLPAVSAGDGRVVYYDAIVAVVNGKPITGYQLREEIKASNIMEQFKGDHSAETMKKVRERILDKIIEQEVLYLEFLDLKASIPAQMIQERLDQMVLQQADGNMERFEDILYQNRMTVSEMKKKIFRRMASEMLLYDRVQRDIQVSEPEIQDYYEKHSGDFREKPGYRLQEIQLKKNGRYAGRLPETWKQIRAELAGGKSFAETAEKYSEDYLAAKGGDMGWQSELNEKLMEMVRHLVPGQIASGIMTAGQGEYLIRLMDRKDGGLRPLDEQLRRSIEKVIREDKEKARYKEYMAPLMLKYGVRKF